MVAIVVSTVIDASTAQVWETVSDLASHTEWMRDAEAIAFHSPQRRGVGANLTVRTRVGPFTTSDRIEVIGWNEGHSIEVAHHGLIRGRGRFQLAPTNGSTLFTWSEEIRFPWWLGGAVTALAAQPILAHIWTLNLETLRRILEQDRPS